MKKSPSSLEKPTADTLSVATNKTPQKGDSFIRPVLAAVDGLNDRLIEADCVGGSLALAAGENPPVWVDLFQTHVERIRQAAEVLETLVRGYGGYAPHGDADGSESPFPSRGANSPSLGAACAP
jgi:hypothetical protein